MCNEANWGEVIYYFVSQESEEEYNVAVTDKFSSLYSDYNDVFLKKIPSHMNYSAPIYSIETEEQSDYKKLTTIYRCFEINNTKNMRLYKVHFILDDKQYIDDVEIVILE